MIQLSNVEFVCAGVQERLLFQRVLCGAVYFSFSDHILQLDMVSRLRENLRPGNKSIEKGHRRSIGFLSFIYHDTSGVSLHLHKAKRRFMGTTLRSLSDSNVLPHDRLPVFPSNQIPESVPT